MNNNNYYNPVYPNGYVDNGSTTFDDEQSYIENIIRWKFYALCEYYSIPAFSDDMAYIHRQRLDLINLILNKHFVHIFDESKLDSISLDDFYDYECNIIYIIKYKLGQEDTDYKLINTEI